MAGVALRWYDPKSKPDRLYRKLVHRFDGIPDACNDKAKNIAAYAEVILEPHHVNNAKRRAKEGKAQSYIKVEKGDQGIDSFVNLYDPDGDAHHVEFETGALRKAAHFA